MKLVVVMPAYQEVGGIHSFLTELNQSLIEWDPKFVVVDDCSSDKTGEVATDLNNFDIQVAVIRNDSNLGHGPSTIKALHLGLQSDADVVVAIDGDGQFLGDDVKQAVNVLLRSGVDVVEGSRTNRHDPLYRKVVSFVTRELVARKSGLRPRDANTPLRVYRKSTLGEILAAIPADAATPNLLISVFVRSAHLSYAELPVRSLPRRGQDQMGITWGKTPRQIPSTRFVRFCFGAARQWSRL